MLKIVLPDYSYEEFSHMEYFYSIIEAEEKSSVSIILTTIITMLLPMRIRSVYRTYELHVVGGLL